MIDYEYYYKLFDNVWYDSPKPHCNIYYCEYCNTEKKLIDKIYLVCTNCGDTNITYDGFDTLTYANEVALRRKEYLKCFYKRTEYFDDLLQRIQTHNNYVLISENEINAIQQSLTNTPINATSLKTILKKLNMKQYYRNIFYILTLLDNGEKQIILSTNECNRLKELFNEVNKLFEKYKGNRKNFLNYYYVLHNLLNMIGRNDIAIRLPKIKGIDKINANKTIWDKIEKEFNSNAL